MNQRDTLKELISQFIKTKECIQQLEFSIRRMLYKKKFYEQFCIFCKKWGINTRRLKVSSTIEDVIIVDCCDKCKDHAKQEMQDILPVEPQLIESECIQCKTKMFHKNTQVPFVCLSCKCEKYQKEQVLGKDSFKL